MQCAVRPLNREKVLPFEVNLPMFLCKCARDEKNRGVHVPTSYDASKIVDSERVSAVSSRALTGVLSPSKDGAHSSMLPS